MKPPDQGLAMGSDSLFKVTYILFMKPPEAVKAILKRTGVNMYKAVRPVSEGPRGLNSRASKVVPSQTL